MIPVLGMAILAGLFLFTSSTTLRLVYTIVLALPLIGIVKLGIVNPAISISLVGFEMSNAKDDDTGVAIMSAVFTAGGDGTHPEYLSKAISRGPRLTELLLRAGADPNNSTEDAGRPAWWSAISTGESRHETLRLLIERGAPWRDEWMSSAPQSINERVQDRFAGDLQARQIMNEAFPPGMLALKAFFEAQTGPARPGPSP